MRERVVERLEVGRRLGDDVAERERARAHGALGRRGAAVTARREAVEREGRHGQARRAARGARRAGRPGRRVAHAGAEHALARQRAVGALAAAAARAAGLEEVGLGVAARRREDRLLLELVRPAGAAACAALLRLGHARAVPRRRRAVDVVGPVLDFGGAGAALLVRLVGELADLPREEPAEHDGHEEPQEDDADDDDERDVEDDVGRDAAERDRVDEADPDRVDEALGDVALARVDHERRDVAPGERVIRARLEAVEDGRVRDLGRVEPVEEREVEDGSARRGARRQLQALTRSCVVHSVEQRVEREGGDETHPSYTARLRLEFLRSSHSK